MIYVSELPSFIVTDTVFDPVVEVLEETILLIFRTELLPEEFVRIPTNVVDPILTLAVFPVIVVGLVKFGAAIFYNLRVCI